jgi:hypothetical protein
MTKGVRKGVRTRPISRDRCGVGSETGFSLGVLGVGASRLELLTPCL